MSINALSTAGFSQYIAASSNLSASQKAYQALQQSLAQGNLTGAQTAFTTYQRLNQASGSTTATQFSTNLKALGTAIGSGSVTKSQSAFATLQADLKTSPSQAIANAQSAAAQTVQWVSDLLNLSTPRKLSTPISVTAAILKSAYGQSTNGQTASQNTDVTTNLLRAAYGVGSSTSNPTTAATNSGSNATGASSTTGAGAPRARVNTYA